MAAAVTLGIAFCASLVLWSHAWIAADIFSATAILLCAAAWRYRRLTLADRVATAVMIALAATLIWAVSS
jgi:hypothetical protein